MGFLTSPQTVLLFNMTPFPCTHPSQCGKRASHSSNKLVESFQLLKKQFQLKKKLIKKKYSFFFVKKKWSCGKPRVKWDDWHMFSLDRESLPIFCMALTYIKKNILHSKLFSQSCFQIILLASFVSQWSDFLFVSYQTLASQSKCLALSSVTQTYWVISIYVLLFSIWLTLLESEVLLLFFFSPYLQLLDYNFLGW